ncbi:hypothetical protein LJR084_006913 [Variovorax sp. LjRoot84]|uniref:hypothetical protein n=1 Tax=Variovorax sp. LjRoot84 TaxID=3342340 RepID=UPI003ECEDF30
MSFAQRFIGAETLPSRMSEFDVRQFFSLSKDDISAIGERFRHDRRVAAAIQLPFPAGKGSPDGPICRRPQGPAALGLRGTGRSHREHRHIASLRSLYERAMAPIQQGGGGHL